MAAYIPPVSRRVGRRVVPQMDSARSSRSPDPGLRRPTPAQRLRYAFDNTMARGTPALIGWLALATLALIGFFTAVVLLADLAPGNRPGPRGAAGQAFESLLHALDPGTIANDPGGHWPFLIVMLLVTVGGLFVVSALIGVIATGLDSRIERLRKGRSVVLEDGHTLILGWSDTVFTVLSELEIANESRRRPSAVVLADRDKVEMDDLIREKVRPRRTRVITRSGSPIDLGHLALVRPERARSIVVLSPEEEEESDAQVIKTILALTRGRGHRDRRYHIVAEIHDPANLSAARLVGGEEAVLIDKRETIARLVVHSARQSGASVAFTELLDFKGDEIYFREDPALAGGSFGDAVLAYEDCSVIGLIDAGGDVLLNPPGERRVEAGEQVIAVAADDARLAEARPLAATVDREAIVSAPSPRRRPESVLVLGWNAGAPAVIREFDARASVERECRGVANTAVECREASPTALETIEEVGIDDFDHVIVLTAEGLDSQRADARTLVTLLHLREIADRRDVGFSIVSEMVDERNRQLAEVTRVDDVIVSDKIISLMLTQISETRALARVFEELFSAEGSEIYLRPACDYLADGRETSYATLVAAALERGECAIGYRLGAQEDEPEREFGVRVNPPKSDRISLGAADRVIVLAEE
jgi:Trk K+ transport system NAD-binding subunit